MPAFALLPQRLTEAGAERRTWPTQCGFRARPASMLCFFVLWKRVGRGCRADWFMACCGQLLGLGGQREILKCCEGLHSTAMRVAQHVHAALEAAAANVRIASVAWVAFRMEGRGRNPGGCVVCPAFETVCAHCGAHRWEQAGQPQQPGAGRRDWICP